MNEHSLELVSDFTEDGYTPQCSCGWEGKRWDLMVDAGDEWENHCDAVFMEATEGGQ